MKQTVNILGREYLIRYLDYDKSVFGSNMCGFCIGTSGEILICRLSTHPDFIGEDPQVIGSHERLTLRHEIVHAFLHESGLSANTSYCDAWAYNEEMVDWIALQGPKLYKAWKEAEAV